MRPVVPIVVGVILVVAACSGAGESDGTLPDSIPTSSTTTARPATSASTATTTTVSAPDETALIAATWNAYLDAWSAARISDPIDVAGLEAVASAPLVVRVGSEIAAERVNPAGGTGWIVTMEFETSPLAIDVEGDAATWEGCTAIREVGEPIDPDAIGVVPFDQLLIDWELVTLRRTGSGWVVESREIVSDHCVPADLEDATVAAIVAGYEEYWDRRPEFLDPPDPASPAIDDVAAGSANEFLDSLAQRMTDEGVALRGRPDTHPELSEFGLGTAVIVDCQGIPDAWGAFDVATGERRSDILEVVPGQRDARQTFLVMEDGRWKVALLRGATDVECEFGQLTSQ